MRKINIAIDGPAASGKSTTAQLLAKKLHYLYIDTGAMYRALTLAVQRAGISLEDKAAIKQIAADSKFTLQQSGSGIKTFLDSEDVSELIRMPAINNAISIISACGEAREIMVKKQQDLAGKGGVVMDGRDIGTVVLPGAELKIFMQASIEQRAQRRFSELTKKNITTTYEAVKLEIIKRDKIDSSRDVAPLKPAQDAIIIDTSELTIEQQVEQIYNLAIEIIKQI